MKACKNCHKLTKENTCPDCGTPTSSQYRGYLIIVDPQESKIAQKVNIKKSGKYALKVR